MLAGTLPGSLYDVQQAWNESIVFGALAAAGVLLAVRRPWWAAACFAVALGTKQHVVLLLPLWALWPAFGPRRALGAAAGAAAVTLPFFLWNPGRFWHCVVEFFVDLPARDRLAVGLAAGCPGRCETVAVLLLVAAAYVLVLRGVPRTPGRAAARLRAGAGRVRPGQQAELPQPVAARGPAGGRRARRHRGDHPPGPGGAAARGTSRLGGQATVIRSVAGGATGELAVRYAVNASRSIGPPVTFVPWVRTVKLSPPAARKLFTVTR